MNEPNGRLESMYDQVRRLRQLEKTTSLIEEKTKKLMHNIELEEKESMRINLVMTIIQTPVIVIALTTMEIGWFAILAVLLFIKTDLPFWRKWGDSDQ